MDPQLITPTEQAVDPVFYYIIGISVFFLILITALMIYFAVKYHRSRHPHPTSQVSKNVPLELIWTIIPTLLALSMFYYGWAGYLSLRRVPENALEVTATGRMWSWLFEYDNGRTSDRLYVPTERPVKVNILSTDVLHSFYIPAFRVKRDAVPGMTNYVWFTASEPGSYDIYCSEYCGVGHASMITTVEALPQHEFTEWYRGEGLAEEAGEGEALLQKYGCLGCHSLDGTPGVGPSLKGLWGREVTVVTDGKERTLTVDQKYIVDALYEPNKDVVKGFQPVMPTYKDQIPQHDLEELIEYFQREAGRGPDGDEISGEELVRNQGCLGCHSTDGSRSVGPTFQGLYGKEVRVERNGEVVTMEADEDYLRRSIQQPQAEITEGFPPIMPAFPDLTEEEIGAVIEYLKGLGG